MGFTALINDWKQQSTKFLHFHRLHHPWKEERDIQHFIHLLCLMSIPSGFKSLISAVVLEVVFFFLFTGPGDGMLGPVSHSCSWVLMPLKVWHLAVLWDRSPSSDCGCSPPGFPMRNGNHCSACRLAFAAFSHAKQIQHNKNNNTGGKKRGNGSISLSLENKSHESICFFKSYNLAQLWSWSHEDYENTGAKFSSRSSGWKKLIWNSDGKIINTVINLLAKMCNFPREIQLWEFDFHFW